jgi:hypothetical protein
MKSGEIKKIVYILLMVMFGFLIMWYVLKRMNIEGMEQTSSTGKKINVAIPKSY